MEKVMAELGTGERLEQKRRKRYWGIIAFLIGLGAVSGFSAGVYVGITESSGEPFVLPAWMAWVGVSLAAIAFLYGSWSYFRAVDEVDLMDNLWASTVGFYAYAALFGGWVALDVVAAAPPANHLVIFFATIIVATIAYVFRKWRAR